MHTGKQAIVLLALATHFLTRHPISTLIFNPYLHPSISFFGSLSWEGKTQEITQIHMPTFLLGRCSDFSSLLCSGGTRVTWLLPQKMTDSY